MSRSTCCKDEAAQEEAQPGPKSHQAPGRSNGVLFGARWLGRLWRGASARKFPGQRLLRVQWLRPSHHTLLSQDTSAFGPCLLYASTFGESGAGPSVRSSCRLLARACMLYVWVPLHHVECGVEVLVVCERVCVWLCMVCVRARVMFVVVHVVGHHVFLQTLCVQRVNGCRESQAAPPCGPCRGAGRDAARSHQVLPGCANKEAGGGTGRGLLEDACLPVCLRKVGSQMQRSLVCRAHAALLQEFLCPSWLGGLCVCHFQNAHRQWKGKE
jgi:hypothetical protein